MSVTGNIPGVPPGRRRLSAWLQEKLFERRIVLIMGRLDDDAAAEAAAALMSLEGTGDTPIELHLDSHDGTLESAFIVIDTIDLLRAAVRVHGRGQVGGPALGVIAAAAHRSATAHTRFRLLQPTARFMGTPDQIAAYSRQQQELLWRLHARLARATGRPAEEIAEDMRRGRSLDAREALEYGLIDEISAAG
ncbi:MAG TPA: ATP-dependent Clp protease proteolytic subunit [Verrucomicrobiae bacterium]|nr:ATP-dependent Clp protease proteolytic subunit [Verrucomicrobiae bacterium]